MAARKPPPGLIRYEGARGVVWRIKYRDANDRQVMETIGSDRDEAIALLEERRVAVRKGWRRPAPLTFSAALAEWFVDPAVSGDWKDRTRAQYVSIRRRLEEHFGPMKLEEARPSDVVAYRTRRLTDGLAAATVSRDMSIPHSLLAWCVVKEYVDRNVAVGVKHPKVRQRVGVALTPQQVQRLLPAFADEQDRVVFLTFVLLGVRRSELQALRWRNVDFVDERVYVRYSKTETGERAIALRPVLGDALATHKERSAFEAADERVFCHRERGSVYRYETWKDAFERACGKAGVELPAGFRACHDLRVTMITNDAIAGANPTALMTKAGHASMQTTKRYLKLAGVVFPDEADALEARLLGPSANLLPDSHDLTAPGTTLDGLNAADQAR